LIVSLKKCAERPLDFEAVLDLTASLASYPEIETIDPVEVRLRLSPVGGDQYHVRGRVATRLTAYCARCAEPFPLPLERSFELLYVPESKRVEDDAHESAMRKDEVDLAYYQDDTLEVRPLVEEQVILALPMRFLCSENCPGLCPSCGANRRTTACDCGPQPADPRFESLKALIHK
jgi:uncharacterized protein